MLVFLPLMILMLVLLIGVFERTTPNINVQEMDVAKRPIIDLNMLNYRVGLKFITKNSSILDSSEIPNYFEIKVGAKILRNDASGFVIEDEKLFEFKPCDRADFLDFQEYYDMNLKKAICLKNHNFTLEGYWDESKISYAYMIQTLEMK